MLVPADPAWKVAIYDHDHDTVLYRTVISFGFSYEEGSRVSPEPYYIGREYDVYACRVVALVDPSTGEFFFLNTMAGGENEAAFKEFAKRRHPVLVEQREEKKTQQGKRK